MKSIICFTESLAGGGAEHQMSILCRLLSDAGYDVTLVTYSDSPDHYELPNAVKRIRLGEGKSNYYKIFEIFKFFIKVKADSIISYRQACNARLLIPLLFRQRKGLNIICSERNVHYGKSDKYEKVLFGGLYKRADFIVTNSFTQANYIKHIKPLWESKIRTIINYTDVDLYKPIETCLSDSIIKIGIFSRVAKQKNVENFIKAVALLKKRSDKLFEIHWYGNIELDCPYEKMVKRYNVSDVLFFHDAVINTGVVMQSYHAICQPSLYEGFSNSIAEAICCGMPVLASDVSDNGLMVEETINGFLFNPLNIEEISSAFERFFNLSISQINEMKIKSREKAETLFDKEKFTESYISIIERM